MDLISEGSEEKGRCDRDHRGTDQPGIGWSPTSTSEGEREAAPPAAYKSRRASAVSRHLLSFHPLLVSLRCPHLLFLTSPFPDSFIFCPFVGRRFDPVHTDCLLAPPEAPSILLSRPPFYCQPCSSLLPPPPLSSSLFSSLARSPPLLSPYP